MIERASHKEQFPVRPKSIGQRKQQEVFQWLGHLYRTRANIQRAQYLATSKLRKAVYHRALQAIDLDIYDAQFAMQTLPNKKRIKEASDKHSAELNKATSDKQTATPVRPVL